MKNTFKILGVLLLAAFVFASCSKDTDPADTDIFTGKYEGTTSYSSSDKNVASGNGTVTVVKVGSHYRFSFDRGIPDFGEDFDKKSDNTFVSIGSNGFTGISINEKKLTILVAKDGKTWTANADRK